MAKLRASTDASEFGLGLISQPWTLRFWWSARMTDLTNNLDPKEKVFRAWAPQESIWSPWVKPVLFASMNFLFPPSRPDPIEVDLSWISEGDGSALYILDLPGAAGVWASPALMKKGLQPIPLYNALPSPL